MFYPLGHRVGENEVKTFPSTASQSRKAMFIEAVFIAFSVIVKQKVPTLK